MKRLLLGLGLFFIVGKADAFCGFYVAKADAGLYNHASQVVYVHDADKHALTIFNDYRGEASDFALVIPVPVILTREQINVGDRALIERVDAFSAPRLVEYYDPDPCAPNPFADGGAPVRTMMRMAPGAAPSSAKSLGVTVEAQYTVGEYDIVILSAKESKGLETYLKENGYKLPEGAAKSLSPYVRQGLKFFVAKVNVKEHAKSGYTFLRPIQFAFESKRFMLPIRLGMLNAQGPQDLIVYLITRRGRAESVNYRTVNLPTGMDVPSYVKEKFPDFYRSMFQSQYEKENKKVIFLEYAWNTGSCDPCAADPLTKEELRKLGVFWLDEDMGKAPPRIRPGIIFPGNLGNSPFLTRLHVRYDAEHFPEDLVFQETPNSETFQGRYVLRHPWTKEGTCAAMTGYREQLKNRREKEAQTLASLTGWPIEGIYKEIGAQSLPDPKKDAPKKWYEGIFK